MAFGFGVLRMPPAAFWAMTLREVAAAIRAVLPEGNAVFGTAELDELMKRFPDV